MTCFLSPGLVSGMVPGAGGGHELIQQLPSTGKGMSRSREICHGSVTDKFPLPECTCCSWYYWTCPFALWEKRRMSHPIASDSRGRRKETTN